MTTFTEASTGLTTALALSGEAEIIVTGDRDMLALHPFRGITVLTPNAYLHRHTQIPRQPKRRENPEA